MFIQAFIYGYLSTLYKQGKIRNVYLVTRKCIRIDNIPVESPNSMSLLFQMLCPIHPKGGHAMVRSFSQQQAPQIARFHPSCSHYRRPLIGYGVLTINNNSKTVLQTLVTFGSRQTVSGETTNALTHLMSLYYTER